MTKIQFNLEQAKAGTQEDKLFALYAANIAAGATNLDNALREAQLQLNYFNSMATTPPAQEGTGLYVARDKDGEWLISDKKPTRGCEEYDSEMWVTYDNINNHYIPDWLAIALVGPMTWEDEPRKVKISTI